jgi:hypothetical protein
MAAAGSAGMSAAPAMACDAADKGPEPKQASFKIT